MPPMSNENLPIASADEYDCEEMRRLVNHGNAITLDGAIVLAVETAKERLCKRPKLAKKTLEYYESDSNGSLAHLLFVYAEEELSKIRPAVHEWYDWEEAYGLLGREGERHLDELRENIDIDIDDERRSHQ